MSKHSKDAETHDFPAAAGKMAADVASTLPPEHLARAGSAARIVTEGLREIVKDDESAAQVAMAFAKLISMLAKLPVEDAAQVIDQTVVAYAMACGHLAGQYELPAPPAADESPAPTDATAVKYL